MVFVSSILNCLITVRLQKMESDNYWITNKANELSLYLFKSGQQVLQSLYCSDILDTRFAVAK